MIGKMRIISVFVLLLPLILLTTGCRDVNLIKVSYKSTDMLIAQIEPPINYDQTVLTASFVNIDNLEESSTFGRTVSEYIGSRLAQLGYKVVELKLRKSIFMKKTGGEFVLSRELKDLSTTHQAQAIVVGTYSIGKDVVYVSSRVIKLADSTILSSHAYKMPLTENLRQLLGYY